jgi:hypothetical protein
VSRGLLVVASVRHTASWQRAGDCPPYLKSPRATAYLPEGDGLGASRPDSINVGRIGAAPSIFVPRDPDELFCSNGVSLFTGLEASATVGLGT